MSRRSFSVKIDVGKDVIYQSKRCTVKKLIDLDTVLLFDFEKYESLVANINEIEAVATTTSINTDLEAIDDNAWNKARLRFEAISPLLNSKHNRTDVQARAKELNIGTSTLYKWLKQYKDSELLTSLASQRRSDNGKSRLTPEIDKLIQDAINNVYLTTQRKSVQKVHMAVQHACFEQNLQPPHINTLRNRIDKLCHQHKVTKRHGRKVAGEQFSPLKGSFPDADFPLSVVQIDHTKLDIILVDDHYRRPIGRPWITLAIDVFSRMVAGFYISFDPPGAMSTGLCLAHSILAKDQWLSKHETQNKWSLWGIPRRLHLDNAKEFRGRVLERACQQYNIGIEWRPVARPNFGAHIERLLGTFLREIHSLPGATGSNIIQRKGFDPENRAIFTLSDFETWLTTFIVDVYHQRRHSAINMSPVERFQQGVLGNGEQPGTGLPAKITDENRLRTDFLPFEERSVQPYGVVIDEIYYWHDVLRNWIGAPDPNNKAMKRKFIFRRDPRDLSQLWFYDPELEDYYAIPYRNSSHPVLSIWELREAKAHLKNTDVHDYDERALFAAYDRMLNIEAEAQGKTVAARRAQQRRTPQAPIIKPKEATNEDIPELRNDDEPKRTIKPFDDLDFL
jgi:putative transposase